MEKRSVITPFMEWQPRFTTVKIIGKGKNYSSWRILFLEPPKSWPIALPVPIIGGVFRHMEYSKSVYRTWTYSVTLFSHLAMMLRYGWNIRTFLNESSEIPSTRYANRNDTQPPSVDHVPRINHWKTIVFPTKSRQHRPNSSRAPPASSPQRPSRTPSAAAATEPSAPASSSAARSGPRWLRSRRRA